MRAAGRNMLTRESAISFFIKGAGFITSFKVNGRYAPCMVYCSYFIDAALQQRKQILFIIHTDIRTTYTG
jgi:hypothetical protein